VLAYLSRYTHRVAISNSRLIGYDAQGVTFKWKDYRAKPTKRLATDGLRRPYRLPREAEWEYAELVFNRQIKLTTVPGGSWMQYS
jgi:hypothetical protein